MPDAKQRLRTLDRIDPPDVWHRATQLDPSGDLPPGPHASWQRRVVAGTVAFAVFAGAVALVLGAFGGGRDEDRLAHPGSREAAVLTLAVDGNEPTARFAIGERSIEGMGSSYCWQQNDTTSFCADTIPPELRADDLVAVGPSQPLEVRGDAEEVRIAVLAYPLEPYERIGRVDLQDGNGTLPGTPGRYVLEVSASWPQGDRSFYLGIEVEGDGDPGAPEPATLAPIEVTTPAAGDTVSSPVTIAGTADVFEATVSIQIFDATNNVIADTFATATCGSGCRGDFSIEVPFSVGSTQPGVIRVFEVSAENGKAMNVVRIPVTLEPGVDPVAEAVEGTWQDADGTPLPDGTDAADDFALVLHTLEGPDHCGWTSVTFLHLGWPLGTRTEPPGDFRQYLRDPQGVLRESLVTPFGADGAFPADAEPTGFHRGGWELWTAPSDVDEAVYVVEGDPRAGGTWERWPRTTEIIACE